jgi:hypothetical protein
MSEPKPRPSTAVFDGIRSRIAEIRDLLGKAELHDEDFKSLDLGLDWFQNELAFATPTELCPYCFGRGDGCRFCNGLGWVSEAKLRLAPTELVEMARRLNG